MAYFGGLFDHAARSDLWNAAKNSAGGKAIAAMAYYGSFIPVPENPGFDERVVREVAGHSEPVVEGIYEFIAHAVDGPKRYVGQSGNIDKRLAQHVTKGTITKEQAANAARTEVKGGKTAREIAEQKMLDGYGGPKNPLNNVLNKVNPVGCKREGLMGPGYKRP